MELKEQKFIYSWRYESEACKKIMRNEVKSSFNIDISYNWSDTKGDTSGTK